MGADRIPVIILAGGKKRLRLAKRRGWLLKAALLVRTLVVWVFIRLHHVFAGHQELYDEEFDEVYTEGHEIVVGGKRCVDRIIEACREATGLGKIMVVANSDPGDFAADQVVRAGETLADSIAATYESSDCAEGLALIIFADTPFVTPAMLNEFIGLCEAKGKADLYCSFIERSVSIERYPDLPHTWARFLNPATGQHEHFCSGGLVLVRIEQLPKVVKALRPFFAKRKSVIRLAWLIGLLDLLSYFMGDYTIADLKRSLSRIFGIAMDGVLVPHAEVGFNIDDAHAYRLAQRYARV